MSFKKAALFTDIHWGKKSNSEIHNQDCLDYTRWFISEAKKFGAETAIFCGDWFDTRASLNVRTLDYALKSLELLSKSFEKVVILMGNHDLFYKGSREIHSLCYAKHIDNIQIIDEITIDGDCAFIPWLINNEWEQVKNTKTKYVFGHLELPNFFTNAKITMHDIGKIKGDDFAGPEYIFSGHFHLRQVYKNPNGTNIIYFGNCFPHNFSDANDIERGCVLLENGCEPQFVNWGDCPRYLTCTLSELLEQPESYLSVKSYVRVESDINIDYNDTSFIREVLINQFNCRELIILPKKAESTTQDTDETIADIKMQYIQNKFIKK